MTYFVPLKHPLTGELVCPWCRKLDPGTHTCYDLVDLLRLENDRLLEENAKLRERLASCRPS